MAISDELLDQILSTCQNEEVRRHLHEALTQEITELSEVRSQMFELTHYLGEVDIDELRSAQPDTLRRELGDLETTMGDLTSAYVDLLGRASDLTNS